MVQTRASTLATGAGKAAARSFAQAFPATKAGASSYAAVANSDKVKRARTIGPKEVQPESVVVRRRTRGDVVVKAEAKAPAAGATATARGPKVAAKPKAQAKAEPSEAEPVVMLSDEEARLCTTMERPQLTFSVQDALDHLCAADVRFVRLRNKVGLRNFTSASSKPLNLFQTLCTSILGQQISWLAARAILYKFTRIWWPELPEKPDWDTLARDQLPFPTPRQVWETDDEAMRAAGLSYSKIRYVRGLAEKFGSGQMDVRELMAEKDEGEIVRKLVELKGVGVWTAQMCMIFALRLPNVLSHADLGIQKGMVIWYLAGPQGPTIRAETRKPDGRPGEADSAPAAESDKLNEALADASTQTRVDAVVSGDAPVDVAVVAGAVDGAARTNVTSASDADDRPVPPIPADSGLTVRILEERRKGKKVKGMYLTPAEMDSLAKKWHPYESIASLFMWSLID